MIQDIFPYHFDNTFRTDVIPNEDSIILHYVDGGVLMKGDLFPRLCEFPKINVDKLIYLFSVDEKKYFLLDEGAFGIKEGNQRNIRRTTLDKVIAESETIMPVGYTYRSMHEIRKDVLSKKYRIFVAYTGQQLWNWYHNNKYCGRCGKKTHLGKNERTIVCSCGYVSYPRIVPAVIVGVINKHKILLTKYRTGYSHFALVAGFVEVGETLEEAVMREVKEETGLKVKNLKYYKSQPWGVVDDLLMGFFCEVDGDDTINIDENELAIGVWMERKDIILQPDDLSLTNEMMNKFREGEVEL